MVSFLPQVYNPQRNEGRGLAGNTYQAVARYGGPGIDAQDDLFTPDLFHLVNDF